MSVLIGHASIDENGRASGGQAGDQTGKEVCVRIWYNGNWNIVLRPKSAAVAEKMASSCETLCRGNIVGYDQGQRNDLWDALELVNWNPAKLKEPCETDCSQLMAACARCAGINIPRVALGGGRYNAPVTQTMRSAFSSTGAFEVLTDPKYLTSDKYLKRGDILLRESGHVAMVLSDGAYAGTTATAKSTSTAAVEPAISAKEVIASGIAYCRDNSLTGVYECTAPVLDVRDAAGDGKKSLAQIRQGATVHCYGYYSLSEGVKWLYITFAQNGTSYTAFASEEFLKKM